MHIGICICGSVYVDYKYTYIHAHDMIYINMYTITTTKDLHKKFLHTWVRVLQGFYDLVHEMCIKYVSHQFLVLCSYQKNLELREAYQ